MSRKHRVEIRPGDVPIGHGRRPQLRARVISHAQAIAASSASLRGAGQIDAAAVQARGAAGGQRVHLLDAVLAGQDARDVVVAGWQTGTGRVRLTEPARARSRWRSWSPSRRRIPRRRSCATSVPARQRHSWLRTSAGLSARSRSSRGSRTAKTPSSSPSSRETSVEPTWPMWKIHRASVRGLAVHRVGDLRPWQHLRVDRLLQHAVVEEARRAIAVAIHGDQAHQASRRVERLRQPVAHRARSLGGNGGALDMAPLSRHGSPDQGRNCDGRTNDRRLRLRTGPLHRQHRRSTRPIFATAACASGRPDRCRSRSRTSSRPMWLGPRARLVRQLADRDAALLPRMRNVAGLQVQGRQREHGPDRRLVRRSVARSCRSITSAPRACTAPGSTPRACRKCGPTITRS